MLGGHRGRRPSASSSRRPGVDSMTAVKLHRSLARVSPNPAFMTNWCSTFLAEDLTRAGDQALDDLEDLDVLQVSAADLGRRIGDGELVNSLSVVAFFLYQRHRAERA